MSAFLSLRTSIVAALQAAPALAGVTVTDQPDRVQPDTVDRAILVRLVGADNVRALTGCDDWATLIELQAGARRTAARPNADATADDLLAALWTTVSTLGASLPDVIDIKADPAISFTADLLDTAYSAATLRLSVVHRTHSTTLQPWST